MRQGDVALARLPQADGQLKNRPVILLRQMPPFDDWLVCGVSTQLQQRFAGFDEVIEQSHPDFSGSGLKPLRSFVWDILPCCQKTTFSEQSD